MSAVDNVIDAIRQPFLDVATDISGSLVYLDAGAAEVAQLSLGPAFLLGLGATNVCDLERCHPDDALLSLLASGQLPTAVVVFTTQLLTETHQHVVHLLMVHPQVQRCLLFCSVSELAHAQLDSSLSPLGVEAYSDYVAALRQDLATARAAAGMPVPKEDQLQLSVKHMPLHVAALDTQTFVLPAAGAVASRAVAGGRAAGFGATDALADKDADEGAVGASGGLSLLPHCLADLSRVLGARLEPFAIGPVSATVAKELAALPQQGSRTAAGLSGDAASLQDSSAALHPHGGPLGPAGSTSSSIGLVLIDRSLDLATPCMHGDHVLDVVLASLPRADAVLSAVPPAAGRHGRVALRPADLRVDVPHLAPLNPLVAPTQQQQQTAPTALAADATTLTTSSRNNSSSSRPGPTAARPLCIPMGLSLHHPSDRRWLGWLQQLWPKRSKDALLLLRKWLKEALRLEKVSPATRSRLSSVVSPAELLNLAQCLMATPEVFLRHTPIVGLALAAASALSTETGSSSSSSSNFWPYWDRLGGLERQVLLALPEGSEGASMLQPMLMQAIDSAKQGRLLLDHVLQLLVVVYSLSGDRMPPAPPLYSADEAQLRAALAEAMLAAAGGEVQEAWPAQLDCVPAAQHLLQEAVQSGRLSTDPAGVRSQLDSVLVEVFQRLRWLAASRGKLRDVRRLMQVDVDTGAASNTNPLVRQVLTKILLQADNRDLQQPENASLVAGLFHKGLGRLGFGGIGAPSRARISDYQTVLLFVVGGISPAEIREVRQELEEHKFGHKPTVLLGGTSLLTATDATRLLLS